MRVALAILVVQLAILAIAEGRIPKRITKPLKTQKDTETEWANILKNIKPKIDNPAAKPIIQPSSAGKRAQFVSPFIIGGSVATLGQFPWQVYFDVDDSFICGGSLILEDWVLTAAHCIGTTHSLIIGTINIVDLSPNAVTITPERIYVHESYDAVNIVNDIALVKLPSKVVLTDNIKLIALPPASDAQTTFEGETVTISGFGKTADNGQSSDDLKYTDLTIISNTECAQSFSSVDGSNICSYKSGTADCQGDSGGPLVYKNDDDTFMQIGVVSYGGSSCLVGPSVYARVTAYLGWMSGIIGQVLPLTTTKSTAATPKTVPTKKSGALNCAGGAFNKLTSSKCSSKPVSPILKNKKDKTCGGSSKTKFFNSYTLNKQQIKKQNVLNLSDAKTQKALAKDVCNAVCHLESAGVITGGVLDSELLADFIAGTQPDSISATVPDIVDSCDSVVSDLNIPTFSSGGKTCDGVPFIMIQCVQYGLILAGQPARISKCSKAFDQFDKCTQYVFPDLAELKTLSMRTMNGTMKAQKKVLRKWALKTKVAG